MPAPLNPNLWPSVLHDENGGYNDPRPKSAPGFAQLVAAQFFVDFAEEIVVGHQAMGSSLGPETPGKLARTIVAGPRDCKLIRAKNAGIPRAWGQYRNLTH